MKAKKQIEDQLREQLGDLLYDGIIYDQIVSKLWDRLGDQLWGRLIQQIDSQLREQLFYELKDPNGVEDES